MNELRNIVIRKEIPKHEIPDKIISITEKDSGLKILTPTQIIQRLRIAHTQVKASNTSENLLNDICQIIHFLYRPKEITEKV